MTDSYDYILFGKLIAIYEAHSLRELRFNSKKKINLKDVVKSLDSVALTIFQIFSSSLEACVLKMYSFK